MTDPDLTTALEKWVRTLREDYSAFLYWQHKHHDDDSIDGLTELAVHHPEMALAEIRDALPCPCRNAYWFLQGNGETDAEFILRQAVRLLDEAAEPCDRSSHADYCRSLAAEKLADLAETFNAKYMRRATTFITVCGCGQYIRWRPEKWSGVLATETHGYCPECSEKLEQEIEALERAEAKGEAA